MGVKRPFDEEAIQELPFKQAKQLDGNTKPSFIAEDFSPHEASEKSATSGGSEGLARETEFGVDHEADTADKELDSSTALSLVTSTSSDEEAGDGGAYFLPLYPDCFEFRLPRRPPIQYEDAYTYLFSSYPRKEVPIGADHQADIPDWNPDAFRKDSLSSYIIDDGYEQEMMGTLVIPMADSIVLSIDDVQIGYGRTNCDCFDKGSIRCVQKHVEDARERLRQSIGEEKFADLGFLDMGEEVALRWTEEEERLFHEVVYSNPVSLGKNFWMHLSAVFPSRTKMELISYYFNVFILRRRAVQNRCDFLDIDSDDDEWQGDAGHTIVKDEDVVADSFGNEGLQVGRGIGFSDDIHIAEGDESGNDDDENFNDDDDKDGVFTNEQDALLKGDHEEQECAQRAELSKQDSAFDYQVKAMDKVAGSNSKDGDAHAGIYSPRHPFVMPSGSAGEETVSRANGLRSEHIRCPDGRSNGTSEGFRSGFVLESCDAKSWDDTFSSSHIKSFDLLPTCNMIEEIFGPCTWKSK